MKTCSIYLLLLLALLNGCGSEDEPLNEAGEPPLITAADLGDLTKLESLLATEADIDVRDSCNWTALMKAAVNGHTAVTQQLLAAGATTGLGDKGGYTAMMLAASNNHAAIVELLLQHGSDINHVESTAGFTALIWAAKRGHLDTVKVLLRYQADQKLRDHKGLSAIDHAEQAGHQEIGGLLQP